MKRKKERVVKDIVEDEKSGLETASLATCLYTGDIQGSENVPFVFLKDQDNCTHLLFTY